MDYINADIDKVLADLNTDYGGDLEDHLGPGWQEILRRRLNDAWYYGYTTGFSDQQRAEQALSARNAKSGTPKGGGGPPKAELL